MGHESEYPAGRVAYTGDVVKGTVRVFRVASFGRIPVFVRVSQNHLIVIVKVLQNFFLPLLVNHESSLLVGHWHE